MEKATVTALKYRNELTEANKKLHEQTWFLVENSHKSDMNTVSTSNSDLTLITTVADEIEMRKFRKMERKISDDQTKLLIDDNINLRIKYVTLLNKCEQKFL